MYPPPWVTWCVSTAHSRTRRGATSGPLPWLQNFKMKFPAGSDPFEAWREGPHDLVLAVAIAAWLGEWGVRRLWIAV
jgi:hypothetical protein